MHLYSVTLQRAGAITQAIVGSFTGQLVSQGSKSKMQEVLVSRGKILELYRFDPDTQQLTSIYAQEVFGVIRSIQPYRYSGGGKDYVIVGSDSGRIVILEWQAEKNKFVKIHMETFGKTGARRIVPGEYLAVEPRGRAVMIGAVEKQKFVYMLHMDNLNRLTISSPLEAHKSHTVLYSMVALDVGFDNPIFACIELDHGESDMQPIAIENLSVQKMLTYYELDLGLNHVVKRWSAEIDRTSHMLVAVPGGNEGPGGVLVCSENAITYKHQKHADVRATVPRREGMPFERGLMIIASTMHKSKNMFFFLMQSEVGDLYRVFLDISDNKVTAVNVKYLDTVHVSNSVCVMRGGFLFVASEFGDHKFYRIQALGETEDENFVSEVEVEIQGKSETLQLFKPKPLTNLVHLQTIESLSPIIDMKVCDLFNEGSNQVICLCGRGPRSTLRILRHGLPVTELAISPLTGNPQHVFTLKGRVTDQFDKYIVISFINYTMVLSIGENVEQIYDSGLKDNVTTLNTSLIGEDSLLQVHPNGLQLIRADKRGHEWDSGKKQVIRAAVNEYQVIIALAGGEIMYFEFDPQAGRLVEIEHYDVGQDVACIAIGAIPPGKQRSRFMAVGLYDKTVRVLSLDPEDCLNVLTRQAVPSEPESINITLMPSLFDSSNLSNYLTIGLNNGIMLRSVMDAVTGELSDTRTRFLGTKPVKLQNVKIQNGQNAVIAMSSRTWLTYYHQGRFHTTPLSYVPLDSCASFISEQCPTDGLVALGDNALRVLSFDKLVGQTFTPSIVPLKYTPRRCVVSERYRKMVIIETDHNTLSPSELKAQQEVSMDTSDDTQKIDQTLPEADYGAPRTEPQSGKWASQIRVFDPITSETTDLIELTDNEAAFSVALCTFTNNPTIQTTGQKKPPQQSDQFVIVGTAQNLRLLPSRSCTSGFLHCYKILENGKLQLIHKTPLEDVPTAVEEFKGRLLVGVKNSLRIFDLGKKKLLRKCENHQFPNSIQTIHVEGNRIYVGDITESFHFVKYNHIENTLTIFADDTTPRWITAAVQLDYDTMAGADKFGNIFVLRLPKEVTEEMEDISGSTTAANRWAWERGLLNGAPQKANLLTQFYVGEIVTSMVKTSLVRGGPQVIIYGTIMGSIGLMIPFAVSQDVEFFNLLEMHLREECPPLCGRDHLAYRSFYFPVKAVVDGDLCEQYLSLETAKQRTVAEDLRRTVAEVAKKIEDVKNQTGF
jgi:splicing factor 3B subunit 3